MKYFWPEKDFTWEELDQITAKVKGKATWEYAGLIWFARHGMQVTAIRLFDDVRFSKEGIEYIRELAGDEVAKWQDAHSDIRQEQQHALEFVKVVKRETRIPTIEDVRSALDVGTIPTCDINSYVLSGKKGYSGHVVVVVGYDSRGFYLNDPGLPAHKEYYVPFELFEKAWAYPNPEVKFLVVFSKAA